MRRFSIAPMMAYTDRHYRYFARHLTAKTLLYTEMVTQDAVIHGDRERLIGFNEIEHPLALQLGGSDPAKLAQCAIIATDFGYDEINLNVGCPSERVQSGSFGACLMKEPALVAECVAAMKAVTALPVTVKCRIGVDDDDSYQQLHHFVAMQQQANVDAIIIHARKAWLKGLSPKENRSVPPLCYDTVYRIKQDFPQLEVILNGGVTDLTAAKTHLAHVDGVMMGRAAYHDMYQLAYVDQELFGDRSALVTREALIERVTPYIEQQMAKGIKRTSCTRHLMGLFLGVPNARGWRRQLSVAS